MSTFRFSRIIFLHLHQCCQEHDQLHSCCDDVSCCTEAAVSHLSCNECSGQIDSGDTYVVVLGRTSLQSDGIRIFWSELAILCVVQAEEVSSHLEEGFRYNADITQTRKWLKKEMSI